MCAILYCLKYKAFLKVAYIFLIFKMTAGYEGGRQSGINYVNLKAEELQWK